MVMLLRFIFLVVVLSGTIGVAQGQQIESKNNARYVVVPGEHILLLLASQPSAPMRFEDAKLLMSIDGRELEVSYSLHNVGDKAIRSFAPVMWTSFGTGGTLYSPRSNGVIQPGAILKDDSTRQVVTLTEELREELQMKGPMKALIVLILENVTFTDNTTYNGRETSNALLSYFEELSDRMALKTIPTPKLKQTLKP
jgi:hypothetical protein